MDQLLNSLKSALPKLSSERVWISVLILIAGIILVKVLLSLFRKVLRRCKIEKGLYNFLLTLMRVLLYMVLGLIIAGTLGINVSSVIAVLSVASLALSLAVQGVLSNLAGSLQVLLSHPFHPGDYVEIGDTGGTVTEISFVYTKITTYDNKEIFIPNKDVAACKIVNYTGRRTAPGRSSFHSRLHLPHGRGQAGAVGCGKVHFHSSGHSGDCRKSQPVQGFQH